VWGGGGFVNPNIPSMKYAQRYYIEKTVTVFTFISPITRPNAQILTLLFVLHTHTESTHVNNYSDTSHVEQWQKIRSQ
jgi:hypothetical protein